MLLHYYLIILLLLSSSLVYFSINPVHSVLFLILTFITSSLILVLFKIEFIALLFVIIYVGAIAILFLFVVMMLNIKKNIITDKINKNLLFSSICFFIFLVLIINSFLFSSFNFVAKDFFLFFSINFDFFSDIFLLNQSLYNYNLILVLIGGLILLVAMIGAVVLTLDFNKLNYVEVSTKQMSRTTNTMSLFYYFD